MTVFDLAVRGVDLAEIAALGGVFAIGTGFLTLPLLYVVHKMRGADKERSLPSLPNAALPAVLVQLPVYNEPGVIAGLLDCVAALDWPRDKLHIQLLDDSTDETVAIAEAKIAQLRPLGLRIDHVRREHRAGFKAEALAGGLATSNEPFVAILDADFRPPAGWLRAVVPRLMAQPRAAFIQSRCEFMNAGANWLTRIQGLLFDAHFVMEQAVRARGGMLFQFNGTAAVWRRAAIDAAGGWSDDSLCEDLCLTVRAAIAGWHGLFAMNPVVPGLVPEHVSHWRVQQQRWAMGFAKLTGRLMRDIWKSDWTLTAKLSAGFLILYQAGLPIAATASVLALADLMLHRGHLPLGAPLGEATALLVAAVALGMTLPPYLELKRGGLGRYLRTVIMLPPTVLYLAFSNAESILSVFLGRNDIFHRTPKKEAALS